MYSIAQHVIVVQETCSIGGCTTGSIAQYDTIYLYGRIVQETCYNSSVAYNNIVVAGMLYIYIYSSSVAYLVYVYTCCSICIYIYIYIYICAYILYGYTCYSSSVAYIVQVRQPCSRSKRLSRRSTWITGGIHSSKNYSLSLSLYIYIYVYIYICVDMCMYICICMCMYVYMYICVYVYTYVQLLHSNKIVTHIIYSKK